ncbi:hypothetical protein Tco_0693709 [Tanacetum coccineum]
MDLDFAADWNLRELSGEEAWEAIESLAQGQKEWDNPPNIISEQEVANLKAQSKRLFGNENVWVEMHRGVAWDKVENTPPVTYPEKVEETIGIPIKVEPLDETPLEDLGLNTCNHDIPLSFREVIIFDEPKPQPQPLPNCPSSHVNLGNERGLEPHIKPHILDSFRMEEGFHQEQKILYSQNVEKASRLTSDVITTTPTMGSHTTSTASNAQVVFDEKKLGSS